MRAAGTARGLLSGTMKNLMVHLRWWAGVVGKGSVVMKDNARYGIEDRRAARGYRDGLELDRAKQRSSSGWRERTAGTGRA